MAEASPWVVDRVPTLTEVVEWQHRLPSQPDPAAVEPLGLGPPAAAEVSAEVLFELEQRIDSLLKPVRAQLIEHITGKREIVHGLAGVGRRAQRAPELERGEVEDVLDPDQTTLQGEHRGRGGLGSSGQRIGRRDLSLRGRRTDNRIQGARGDPHHRYHGRNCPDHDCCPPPIPWMIHICGFARQAAPSSLSLPRNA